MKHTLAPASANGSQERTAISLIDSDVHNYPASVDVLMPYLTDRWQAYIKQSGFKSPPPPVYPKGFDMAAL